MGTITSTNELHEKYSINTNGLGTVVDIKLSVQKPDDTYTKYEKHKVYLKPTWGATFKTFKTWNSGNMISDGVEDPFETEEYVQDVSRPTNADFKDSEFGLIYIGEYEDSVSVDVFEYDDTDNNSDNDDEQTHTTIHNKTIHVEFIPETNFEFNVTTRGTKPKFDVELMYSYLEDDGAYTTYVALVGNQPYYCSNAVAFSNRRQYMGLYIGPTATFSFNNGGICRLDDVKNHHSIIELGRSDNSNIDGQFIIISNKTSENPYISELVLYINSSLAIFHPFWQKITEKPYKGVFSLFQQQEEETAYSCVELEPDGMVGTLDVHNIKIVDANKPEQDEDESSATSVPTDEEWVYFIKDFDEKRCVVKLIEKTKSDWHISDIIKVMCPYARFTEYWVVLDDGFIGVMTKKIIHSSSKMSDVMSDIKGNIILKPIMKPYAEAHLICHANGQKPRDWWSNPDVPEYEPLGVNLLTSKPYETFVKPVKNKYSRKHVKEVRIDAHEQWVDVYKDLGRFFRIVSPFKNEYYFVHGGHLQFDQKKWDLKSDIDKLSIMEEGTGIGCSSIWVSKDSNRELKYVDVLNYHKLNSFYNNNCCIGVYSVSCYGQGIQKGVQKAGDISGIHTSPQNLPLDTPNVFFKFGACATHTGNGYIDDGETNDYSFIMRALKNTYTYQEFSDKFNNTLERTIKKQYAMIYEFCLNNYDRLMTYWLKNGIPNRKEALEYTKYLVLDDIKNNGVRYFCVCEDNPSGMFPVDPDSDKRVESWVVDENTGNIKRKKFPICDTFIGWLKANLFGDKYFVPEKYYKNPFTDSVPIKFPNDDAKQRKYKIDYIDEHGPTPSESIDELKENLINMQFSSYVQQYRTSTSLKNLCCKPWTGCSGMFTRPDAKIFTNPDKYVNSWLTSDDDLEYLCQLTKTTDYEHIDMDEYMLKIDTEFREHNEEYNT